MLKVIDVAFRELTSLLIEYINSSIYSHFQAAGVGTRVVQPFFGVVYLSPLAWLNVMAYSKRIYGLVRI